VDRERIQNDAIHDPDQGRQSVQRWRAHSSNAATARAIIVVSSRFQFLTAKYRFERDTLRGLWPSARNALAMQDLTWSPC
jgi:hypothetical protein